MGWWQTAVEFMKGIPALARLGEKFFGWKLAKLPMEQAEHEERKPVRVEKARKHTAVQAGKADRAEIRQPVKTAKEQKKADKKIKRITTVKRAKTKRRKRRKN